MEKDKREKMDIMDKLLMAFNGCSPKVTTIVGGIVVVIMIAQFFSITNGYEFAAALICVVIFTALRFKQGKCWKVLKVILAFLLLVNCLTTPFIGSPFWGFFSDENIQSRKEERFYEGFAHGLYYLSLENFDKALKSFKRIESYIPEEYIKEYYLWYGETAMYAGHNDIGISILEKLETNNIVYNESDKKVVFQYLPICKMLNFLNYEDFNSLKEMAVQYQNTNEQIFLLFELAAICFDDKTDENENRIEQLIEIYAELNDTFEEFDYVKNELLARCAIGLSEKYPEYSIVLLAELFEEKESFFFETFLYHYAKENNLMNIRWISLDYLTGIRNIYEKGWMNYKKKENINLKKYSDKIIKLGYYLGSKEVLKENLRVEKVAAGKYEGYELYNVVPFSENKFLGVFLEALKDENKESNINDMNIAAEAHVCSLTLNGNALEVEPIIVDNQEFTKNILMSKLFIIEQTGLEGKYLVSSINGTGEYLNLQILDVKNNTCVELKNIGEMYHASGYEFDGEKCYVVDYEIDNNVDANMESKVGGSVMAEIDYSQNAVLKELSYSDPAVEFYVEERNEALVFPLENLNRLDGRQIKSEVLLEKIRQNSTPYYKYSLLQRSYAYFFKEAGCNLSGITVMYDANTEDEAVFFFYVRRDKERVELLSIYEIVDGRLKSIY